MIKMILVRLFFLMGSITLFILPNVLAIQPSAPTFFRALTQDSIEEIAALAGEKKLVLLGESSHGTSEFYTLRAEITKELITRHGFRFIAVEGDWTPSWQVNAYIKQLDGAPASAREALSAFTRWPAWLWNNEETLSLVKWLRAFNDNLPPEERVGFYGIDVYSFWDSLDGIALVSDRLDMQTETIVNEALDCLLRFNRNHQRYIQSVGQTGQHCGRALSTAVNHVVKIESPDSFTKEEWFYFLNNMHVLLQGELHYRGMLYQGPSSWNERARNFKETVSRLKEFYPDGSKGIVWAHNTHIGDARATDMANFGLFNIGQLAIDKYGRENLFSIGFGTYGGTVIAGSAWDSPMLTITMPNAVVGSLEHALVQHQQGNIWFNLTQEDAKNYFTNNVFQRAIGVVYNPENEQGNYVETDLLRRYHLFIFLPYTQALRAL